MLFCCSLSPPGTLPPFQPSSFPRRVRSSGEHKSNKKVEHQYSRAQSSRAKVHSFPPETHPADGYCPPEEQDPEADSAGSPDVDALASRLPSCGSVADVRKVHGVAVRSPDAPGILVANNLISSYVRFSEISDARKVFDGMPERSVVSWTAMMNGYQKSGDYAEVVRLFLDMVRSGVRGNSLSFVCLLKSCGGNRNAKLGRQVHCCVVKGRWGNVIVDSALVHFYAQCGDLASALMMFDKMASRDVISWTTMITAYVQQGRGDKALQMFPEMVSEGFLPNEFTVCSILKACAEEKALRCGKQLHGAVLKKLYKDDIHVGSALVTMYARNGEVFDAQAVFDMMPRRNTITWTSLISGYAQSGHGEKAIMLFRQMKMRQVSVNNLTIVGLLSACGSIRSLCLGKELHAHIIKNSIQENLQIGSTLVWCYCKCGEYTYAARILEEMPDRDAISWTAMISGYNSVGHSAEALKSLDDMVWDGVTPNTYTYSSALKACAKLEALRDGRRIHGVVNKTPALSDVFVGSSLIEMYMRCGKVDEARRVFDAMPEHNLVTWKVIITGFAQNGLCEEAFKYMYLMQQEGHNVDDFMLSKVLTSCGNLDWESDDISLSGSTTGSVG